MKEALGRSILKEAFEAAGLSIVEDHTIEVAGRPVLLDGWSEEQRIGYEVLTSEAGDRASFPPEVVLALEEAMGRGELFVLLVDLDPTEELLRRAAAGFLGAMKEKGLLPAPPTPRGGLG